MVSRKISYLPYLIQYRTVILTPHEKRFRAQRAQPCAQATSPHVTTNSYSSTYPCLTNNCLHQLGLASKLTGIVEPGATKPSLPATAVPERPVMATELGMKC